MLKYFAGQGPGCIGRSFAAICANIKYGFFKYLFEFSHLLSMNDQRNNDETATNMASGNPFKIETNIFMKSVCTICPALLIMKFTLESENSPYWILQEKETF